MNPAYEILALQARIERLERDLAAVPSRFAGGSSEPAVYTLEIIDGNTLSDAVTVGGVWASSPVTSVPDAYDPDIDDTFIDGICRANLYRDNELVGKVLVAHYSGNGSPLVLALPAGLVVETDGTPITLPIDGTDPVESVNLYVPYNP